MIRGVNGTMLITVAGVVARRQNQQRNGGWGQQIKDVVVSCVYLING